MVDLEATMSCRRLSLLDRKRLALSVLILLGVSILVFVATQALPGDPAQQILGHTATPDRAGWRSPRARPGPPLLSQYLDWLGELAARAPRYSLATPQSVSSSSRPRASTPWRSSLSAAIAIPLAVLLGTFARCRRDRLARSRHPADPARPHRPSGIRDRLGPAAFACDHVFHALPAVALIPPGGQLRASLGSWRCPC